MIRRLKRGTESLISVALILLVSGICFVLSDVVDYKVVALILLVCVSFSAILFTIWPVVLSALLSALVLNFFFIQPLYTLHIHSAEAALLFFMYIVIALINAVLTSRLRKTERVAREKEEKANLVKLYNTLINSLSHELRTPITTIIGSTDNLIIDRETLSEENKLRLLEEISAAAVRLNRQVGNLLNMSRLESGFIRLKADWVDLNELVYAVIARMGKDTDFHPIRVEEDENLPLFRLDYGLIEQVLFNLISNAIIHTPRGCTVIVRLRCVENQCIIHVEDNGNGMSKADREKAFDKFFQPEHSRTRGTGLGLSIVKGFVEAHGGMVRLEERHPSGLRCIIEIPAETTYLNLLKNE